MSKKDTELSKVLVVAFDGMDKELIEKFDLENIVQKEFGLVDNDIGIKRRMTSELFASFITGETYEKHGLTGLGTDFSWRDRVADAIPEFLVKWVRGFHRFREFIAEKEGLNTVLYTKKHLDIPTLFEKIEVSLPLYVPGYNPEVYWLQGHPHQVIKNYGPERVLKEARYDTELRLREGTATQPGLLEINKDIWDFVMFHVHDPDTVQDLKIGDLEEEYERLDEIAGEILEEFEDWTIIFMSDHGRPEDKPGPHQHNKKAFYSCNKELFGDKTPHITDFHDKILELTGNKEDVE
jgi:hypothetical protein